MKRSNKEWLPLLYGAAADLGITVPDLCAISQVHPDRLNNGGQAEAIHLILAEGDDCDWLMQKMCELKSVLYCYNCEKLTRQVTVRRPMIQIYDMALDQTLDTARYISRDALEPGDIGDAEIDCAECGYPLANKEKTQFIKQAGLK